MKKGIKILITSCVVAVGVGASFAGSIALYVKNAQDTTFDIGTYTHTSSGAVTYKIGEVKTSLGAQKIDPEHKTFTVDVPLGGVYSADIPAQSAVFGSFEVKATIDAALVDHVEWSVYIDGYEEDTYWSQWTSPRKYTDGDETLDAAVTSISHDIAVKAVENPVLAEDPKDQVGQFAHIYFNFKDMTEDNFLDYAEKSIKFDFTFDEPETDEIPLIKGDKTAWSADALEYRMVPNIEADAFQWEFKNLTGFTKMYIHDEKAGGTYYVKPQQGKEYRDDDGNFILDSEKEYNVYYNGSSGDFGDRDVMVLDGEHNVIYQA